MSDNGISRKAVALVVILFALGVALGAVGEYLWNAHVLAQDRMGPARQIRQALQLSGDQAKQFDSIISDERAKFHDLDTQMRSEWDPKYHELDAQRHAEWDPKWDQVRQQGRDRIRAILTPEQTAKFDAFVKKLDEDRKKRQQQQSQQPQQQR
ncbi:MAG TPA: Spy/CpxP family protein refolding chaperone [Candidatus Acidoferrales bacterium]|nr:Spy/CpxP family protein refolding chaperone [Candidatus Acidoferrales bacterium]